MKLKGKKVLVTGLGISGIAAIKALDILGADIAVTDMKKEEELGEALKEIENIEVEKILGSNDVDLDSIDMILKSPGMPPNLNIFKEAREKGIEILTDIELAYRISDARFVCITGTNGKTTSTMLTGEVFSRAYEKVYVTGNVGVGILSKAKELLDDESIFIIEASSFQLEDTKEFSPAVSLITNITPDHLDWHGSYENYIAAKAKIFRNQTENEFTVFNHEDKVLRELSSEVKSELLYFSDTEKVKGVYVSDGKIIWNTGDSEETVMKTEEINIPGRHNLQNIIGVIAVSKAFGIDSETIREAVMNFSGVEHRLEFVEEIDGVKYYNDSKGTNVDSTIKAIEGLEKPINLIAGGKDKGGEFDELIEAFDGKIEEMILLGETAQKIEDTARKHGFTNIVRVKDMKEAVKEASEKAKPGYTVLLSPACASWDMYKSYEVRGEDFKNNVKSLKEN